MGPTASPTRRSDEITCRIGQQRGMTRRASVYACNHHRTDTSPASMRAPACAAGTSPASVRRGSASTTGPRYARSALSASLAVGDEMLVDCQKQGAAGRYACRRLPVLHASRGRSKAVAAQNERSHVRSRPPGPREEQRLASRRSLARASAQLHSTRGNLIIEDPTSGWRLTEKWLDDPDRACVGVESDGQFDRCLIVGFEIFEHARDSQVAAIIPSSHSRGRKASASRSPST